MRISAASPLPNDSAIQESNAVEENEEQEEAKDGEVGVEESKADIR